MTELEKKFLITCLNHMHITISNPDKFSAAKELFAQSQPGNNPHRILTKITDTTQWTDYEKYGLCGAVLKATAYCGHYYGNRSRHNEEIANVINQLIDKYIPLITANTNPNSRLSDVLKNLIEAKMQIVSAPTTTLTCGQKIKENRLLFFVSAVTVVTATVGVLASTVMTNNM